MLIWARVDFRERQMTRIRTGVVSFLNALPLWVALREDEDFELIPAAPSDLADMMARGDLDIGLLPLAEALADDRLSFFTDIGVSADGAVESVGLFSRVPLGRIRSVLLDRSSRTSAMLARLLLGEAGVSARFRAAPVEPSVVMDAEEDAVLLIGDRCLLARREIEGREWHDLSLLWREATGLSFVFAVWAGPTGALTAELHSRLRRALEDGRTMIPEIVSRAAGSSGLDGDFLEEYLRSTIRHNFDDRSIRGMREFCRRSVAAGLLDAVAIDRLEDAIKVTGYED